MAKGRKKPRSPLQWLRALADGSLRIRRIECGPFEHPTRARPDWLRALGKDEPPLIIQIAGDTYRCVEIFKHDSWAATAIYVGPRGVRAVGKFHRQQSVFGFPMRWFGRLVAGHELGMLRRLADVAGVPKLLGPVSVDGRVLPHALAREFVPGRPLRRREYVRDDFFPKLNQLLAELHRRDVAYVDMHKRENIVVDDNGAPHIIDFQISLALPGRRCQPFRVILDLLQQSDRYHFQKHWATSRPDQIGCKPKHIRHQMPWWILVHRSLTWPIRELRRTLLVALGVRSGHGRAHTERFAEDAIRNDAAAQCPVTAQSEPTTNAPVIPFRAAERTRDARDRDEKGPGYRAAA